MRYELFIAIRYIISRRRQTVLSIAAIGIAVMILIVSQAFMAGFTQELFSKTVNELPHVTVSPQEGDEHINLYRSLISEIRNIDGVVATSPYLSGEASFRFKDETQNGILKGIVPSQEIAVLNVEEDIVQGSFNRLSQSRNTIVVGDKFAQDMDVEMGDFVDISFPDSKPLSLEVVGIYDTGTPIDGTLTYTSLETAQDFYDTTDVVNGISIRIEDYNNDLIVAQEIQQMGYKASGWTETNPEILRTIAFEGTSNTIILTMIVIIASFGVVSTLNMLVMSKVREIGILMTMGATKSSIRTIFILQSGILGLTGAVAGTIAGIILALSIGNYEVPPETYPFEFTSIPVIIRPEDVILAIVGVFLLNLIAGVYPAQKAAGLDPVEAIGSR